VLDMVHMEKLGKPAAAIVSGGFEEDAAITGRVLGLPDIRFIVVPDVLTGLPDEEVERQAEDALPQALDILTSLGASGAGHSPNGRTGAEPASVETFTGEDRMAAWERLNAEFLSRGWGDGFPLIAPTPERVEHMLKGTTLSPSHIVGVLPPGNGIATVEKIAINCVMAGCEPAHLPIMIAAVESILTHARPGYDMSTSCDAPLMIVNGPIVDELGINSGRCALGPGVQSKVNIVLGRALRLIKMNIGFNRPGLMDMDTIGSPTKFGMCVGENEAENPWEPFHAEHGFDRGASTVTVIQIRNQKEAADMYNTTPEGVLDTVAFLTSVVPEHYGYYGTHQHGYLILLSPEHASILERYRWSKDSVKRYIWHRAVIPANRHTNQQKFMHGDVIGNHWKKFLTLPESEMEKVKLPVVETPDLYEIVVVGGPTGKSLTFSYTPGFHPVEIKNRAAV
jgi:hypothetical protein